MSSKQDNIANNLYLSALDSIFDGVAIYDENGNSLYVNSAHLKQVFGEDKSAEYLRYRRTNLFDLDKISPPVCNKTITSRTIKQWQANSGVVKYYRTNKTCLVSSTPVELDGNLRFVVSIVRDLTELVDLQKKLEESDKIKESYIQQLVQIKTDHIGDPVLQYHNSKVMTNIYEKAQRIARTNAPVLILGETGVGKDFLARYIHEMSGRKGEFIKVNCGAIPAALLESELFGYEAGAFTGADKKGKIGLIELAGGGTLYLDEIGEMPFDLQVKLLGVLQDRCITRVGGTQSLPIDFRLISATNLNLEEKMEEGLFRQDLFYRINVVTLAIPPLRERTEDIFPLVEVLLKDVNNNYGKEVYFDYTALDWIVKYPWKGNVRELRNFIERVVVLADSQRVSAEMISEIFDQKPYIRETKETIYPSYEQEVIHEQGLYDALETFERLYISDALKNNSTLKKAADAMQIDISTLVRKKKKYKL